jgi:hypothetical protein
MGILDRDRKILWARAHNSCAHCKRSLVEDATANDGESVVGDEAHIVAQSGKGPRAGLIPASEVDLYENLILLCKVHHKLIDDQPATYPVELLRAMKRDHEQWAEQKIRAETSPAVPATDLSQTQPVPDDETPEIVDRVPETAEEIDYVVGHRPWSWEYLMYAGLIHVGLRDAKQRGGTQRSSTLVFRDKQAAIKQISTLMNELTAIIEEINDCFAPQLLSMALGEPGRPGDFRLIGDAARRLVGIYQKCSDWSLRVRTATVPRQTRRLFEIISCMADRPMQDIESYAHQLVAKLNDAIECVSNGRTDPLVLTLTCEITADQRLIDEFSREVKRVRRGW